MRYTVTYRSSNGQPSNEYGTFSSKRVAMLAAEAAQANLIRYAGGDVTVKAGDLPIARWIAGEQRIYRATI